MSYASTNCKRKHNLRAETSKTLDRFDAYPEEIPFAIDSLEMLAQDLNWDWGLKLEIAHECAWSAELRVTLNPNDSDGPDHSYVTFSTGHPDPGSAVTMVTQDAVKMLRKGVLS